MWFITGENPPPGYSPRVFLNGENTHRYFNDGDPTSLELAHQWCKEFCIWRNYDKEFASPKGQWLGYEIRSEKFDEAITHLTNLIGKPIKASVAMRIS